VFYVYSPDVTCVALPTPYRLEIANFPFPFHLAPSIGVTPFEFMVKLY